MLKLFNKFRKRHLRESNFGRYLLYALGEIVLVVVGILIALQINNWNENRQNEARNRTMLRQLQAENLVNHEDELESSKALRDTIVQSITNFMRFLKSDSLHTNEPRLRSYLSGLLVSESYSFSENYLLSYINANLGDNSNLTRELVDLHSDQKDLQYISEKALESRLENFFDYLGTEVEFAPLSIQSYNLISSLEFRNKITLILALEYEVTRQYQRTYRQQQRVDSLINDYLGANP